MIVSACLAQSRRVEPPLNRQLSIKSLAIPLKKEATIESPLPPVGLLALGLCDFRFCFVNIFHGWFPSSTRLDLGSSKKFTSGHMFSREDEDVFHRDLTEGRPPWVQVVPSHGLHDKEHEHPFLSKSWQEMGPTFTTFFLTRSFCPQWAKQTPLNCVCQVSGQRNEKSN